LQNYLGQHDKIVPGKKNGTMKNDEDKNREYFFFFQQSPYCPKSPYCSTSSKD